MPFNIPGSFKYINKGGDKIVIKYSMEVFFEKYKDAFKGKREVELREFLFTNEEIE